MAEENVSSNVPANIPAHAQGNQPRQAPQSPAQTPSPETPSDKGSELIAGQWKNVDDVVKSYREMKAAHDRIQSQFQNVQKATQSETPASVSTSSGTAPEAPKITGQQVQQNESLIRLAAQEFDTAGDLSPDTLDKIAKALGTDATQAKAVANAFKADVEGRKANLVKEMNEAGIKLSPEEVLSEVRKHYTAGQMKALQDATDNGLYGAFVSAAKFAAGKIGPQHPRAEKGEVAGTTSSAGFASLKEVQKALGDRRMQTDGSYMKAQMARLNMTEPSILEQYKTGGLR